MKQTIKTIIFLAAMILTAGQAWGEDYGNIAYGQGTNDGGSLAFYKDAACTSEITITDGESDDLTGLDTDGKVYIKATPDATHQARGVTVTVEKDDSGDPTPPAGVPWWDGEANARRRGASGEETITVETVGYGIYCFVMPDDGSNVTVTATFPTKTALTITADSETKEYDGTELTKNSYTYTDLVEGDAIVSVTITGSQTNVGSSNNVPSAAIIKNGDTDVTASYAITYVNGTLTVRAKQIEKESGTTVTQDQNGYTVAVDEGDGNSGGVINIPGGGSSITAASLTYDRTLTAPTTSNKDVTIGGEPAKLYTTCLPTIPTANANVKYYTLTSVSGSTLHFSEIDGDPQADTPYLVAVTGNSNVTEHVTGNSMTLKKTVTGSSANGYTMMGTQTGLTNSEALSAAGSADNATYILQAGSKWGKVKSDTEKHRKAYIPPFRAYITRLDVTSSGARQMNSSFGDDDATGIDSIRTTDSDGTERWYDLNGRRIAKPNRKGLYIRNGKVTTTTD